MNGAQVQSTLLGWIIPLAISVSVLLRRNTDRRQKLFVLFAGNVTAYYFFSFLFTWQGEPWYERIALAFAITIPQGGMRFFRAFSTGARGMGRLGRVGVGLGVVLLFAVLYPSSMRPAVGPAVLAYVAGFMLVAILNLNVQTKTAATRVEAARIRYLVVGGYLTLTFQIVDRLDHITSFDMPPIGLAMTIIYLYVISQTIVRYRILDLYEMMGRFAVISLMGIALATIYTGLVYWVGAGFSINAFLASLVILILFDPLREFVERKIAEFFFRERHILEQDIGRLRRRITHLIDIQQMTDIILAGFQESRRITHASLYLIDPHARGFDLRGSAGPSPGTTRVEVASARRCLKFAGKSGSLLATELVERRDRYLQEGAQNKVQAINDIIETLQNLQGDVLVPIQGEQDLLGFLSLRDERLRDPFSPEDVAILNALANQVAVAVENSRIYQQTKERDRLAALGQMAAGLAHEIRNPLGSIKGAAQFIEEVAESSQKNQSQRELLSVIVEEVDRLNRVVSAFLVYARPGVGQPRVIQVNDILRRTVQVFETGEGLSADVSTDYGEDLPGIKVDGEQLHQVFLNLMLNAAQAMENQEVRRLDISTRTRIVPETIRSSTQITPENNHAPSRETVPSTYVEIRFADNGPGIAPETLENIFIPFFTTKEKGSGLGLAVCQRIVRDAGGEIEVRSQPGQGSIFTVVIPVHDK